MSIKQLIALADYLDEHGASEEANRVDQLIREALEPGDETIFGEEMPEDLEQKLQREYQRQEQELGLDEQRPEGDVRAVFEAFYIKPDIDKYQTLLNLLEEHMRSNQVEKASPEKAVASADDAPDTPEYNEASLSGQQVFSKLADIADRLDIMGAHKQASMVDAFLSKYADEAEAEYSVIPDEMDWKEEADTEQSKRYDAEYHHSLQVREPKTEKERVDREGYDSKPNVHTYQTKKEAASTRHCPEHIGVQMGRVGESTYQCPLDGKTYNWEVGYTDYDGKHHEGGSVAAQTPDSSGYEIPHRIFDSRENILNRVN